MRLHKALIFIAALGGLTGCIENALVTRNADTNLSEIIVAPADAFAYPAQRWVR